MPTRASVTRGPQDVEKAVSRTLRETLKPGLKRLLARAGGNVVPSPALRSLMAIVSQAELVFKKRAELGPRFIIGDWIVQGKFLRMNFVDRNVDMHVVGVVVHDTDPLMFGVA